MAPEERQSKMLTAWVRAMDDIAVVYGNDGPPFAAVQDAAPGLASRLQDAEKRAARWKWASPQPTPTTAFPSPSI